MTEYEYFMELYDEISKANPSPELVAFLPKVTVNATYAQLLVGLKSLRTEAERELAVFVIREDHHYISSHSSRELHNFIEKYARRDFTLVYGSDWTTNLPLENISKYKNYLSATIYNRLRKEAREKEIEQGMKTLNPDTFSFTAFLHYIKDKKFSGKEAAKYIDEISKELQKTETKEDENTIKIYYKYVQAIWDKTPKKPLLCVMQ